MTPSQDVGCGQELCPVTVNMPVFGRTGRTRHGHIATFYYWRGEVPEGKELDHIVCDTRRCINPWHVEPTTHRKNVLRSSGPAAVNARKERCNRGHLLGGDNLWVQPKTGFRYCRECAKQRAVSFRERRQNA